jgi:hypothetical protein
MRTMLLASVIALGLVQTGLAAGRKPAYDPITDPNLTPVETDVHAGLVAVASALATNCPNVPWQLSTNFGKGLVAWTRQQGIPEARVMFLANTIVQRNEILPCADIPDLMSRVSQNWMRR